MPAAGLGGKKNDLVTIGGRMTKLAFRPGGGEGVEQDRDGLLANGIGIETLTVVHPVGREKDDMVPGNGGTGKLAGPIGILDSIGGDGLKTDEVPVGPGNGAVGVGDGNHLHIGMVIFWLMH